MGIAKIGYQGQPFDERVLEQINQIRLASPNLPISVDGGVDVTTEPLLKAAGATRLVSGSAVFGAEDIGDAISSLEGV
jgi:ribulose-phosphate 3-epimerase